MSKFIFVLILMVLSFNIAFADILTPEPAALPVPRGTEEIKKTKRNIADMDFNVVYYQSSEPIEQSGISIGSSLKVTVGKKLIFWFL